MTLPDERYRAIKMAEQLLRDLCDRSVTPRVPRVIRTRAASALRHYPGSYDLQQLERAAPHVVQERMDDLHRMVLTYEDQTPEHLKGDLNSQGESDLEARQQP
jgi:hypothetical protein